jgi:hypothetical protein
VAYQAAPRTQLVNRNEEIVLPIEDIAEVVASSYDRRFPPKNVFRHSSNLNGAAGGPNAHSQGPHRSSEFNSIANSSGGTVPEYTSASALGGYGAYTPELNMINANSNSNGAQYPHILSASTSTSSLGGAPSSSSGAGGGNAQVVVPVAQRRMSNRSSSGLGGTGGELHGKPGFSNQPKGWICAAIVPSFLHVSFFEKWEIKKVSSTAVADKPSLYMSLLQLCAVSPCSDRGVLQRHRAAVRADLRQRRRGDEAQLQCDGDGAPRQRVSRDRPPLLLLAL